jgi:AraC family transcriptional regulator of adaptative response/methylated-DNA-[protein]-cysteine methyltransferase
MQVTDEKNIAEYYKALIDRNPAYLNKFIVGVKTTGIFCIATCPARKPKYENVLFYEDIKEALRFGYRPCKICKPDEYKNHPPTDTLTALKLLKNSKDKKVEDWQLEEAGLDPQKISMWFDRNHGITFQTYQRMLRINVAYQELQSEKSFTSQSFAIGYNPLSGFGYTYKKLTTLTSQEAKEKNIILMTKLTTPVGPMFACSTKKGICLLEFTDRKMIETGFRDLQQRLNAIILRGENHHLKQLKQEMKEYFGGKRRSFDLSLDTPTTEFRQQVWNKLREIPFGQTASYKEQAIKLGNKKAVRAVANANGQNRIAIVIPCHRIIGSDGSLTGYAGGLDRKKWLLQHEGSYKSTTQLSIFED